MLEFTFWFFVLAGNFLALLFILNKLLFQPLLKVFNERREAIDGSLEAAREMDEEREESFQQMKAELSVASQDAREIFDTLRTEGLEAQRQAMQKAGAEAAVILERARAELSQEAAKARQSLRGDVDRFADEIVSKLLTV